MVSLQRQKRNIKINQIGVNDRGVPQALVVVFFVVVNGLLDFSLKLLHLEVPSVDAFFIQVQCHCCNVFGRAVAQENENTFAKVVTIDLVAKKASNLNLNRKCKVIINFYCQFKINKILFLKFS